MNPKIPSCIQMLRANIQSTNETRKSTQINDKARESEKEKAGGCKI